jgi:hypothetical protein
MSMVRTFSMSPSVIALAAMAVIGMSSTAYACPSPSHTIKTLALNSDGVVTRSVYVEKTLPAKDGTPASVEDVRVVRDRIRLESGDSLNLNASPTMRDASLQAEIYVKSQDRDPQGIFSTTYHVVEVAKSTFGGATDKAVRKAYLVIVKSNYLGNGTYSRGCGEVIRKNLDLESSTDVHQ